MEDIPIDNFTVPVSLLRSWFCDDNSSQHILTYLNISCEMQSSQMSDTLSTESSYTGPRLLALVAYVIFAVGMILNVVLLAVLYMKKHSFKSSWYYMCNLIVADILVLVNMLGFIFFMMYPPNNWSVEMHSYLFPSLDIFLSSASMLSVTAIAVDRLLALYSERGNCMKLRTKLTKYVVGGIWLYCVLIFIMAICRTQFPANVTYSMFVFWVATIVALIGCVSITLCCYVVLGFAYLKQTLFYKSVQSKASLRVENLIENGRRRCDYVKKRKHVWKALMITFSSLPFVSAWSFYLGVQTYEVLTYRTLTSPALNMAMFLLPWIVSAINPVIFMITNKAMRKAFLDLCCFNQKTDILSSSTNIETL